MFVGLFFKSLSSFIFHTAETLEIPDLMTVCQRTCPLGRKRVLEASPAKSYTFNNCSLPRLIQILNSDLAENSTSHTQLRGGQIFGTKYKVFSLSPGPRSNWSSFGSWWLLYPCAHTLSVFTNLTGIQAEVRQGPLWWNMGGKNFYLAFMPA